MKKKENKWVLYAHSSNDLFKSKKNNIENYSRKCPSRINLSGGENNGYMQATRILNLLLRSTFKNTLSIR